MISFPSFVEANAAIKELQVELDRQFPQAQTILRKLEQGPPLSHRLS